MSAGNMILRSQFPDFFASRLAFLDEVIMHAYDAPAITYPEVFNVKTSNRAYEETTGVTGFGLFSEQLEAQPLDYDTILQAYDKRFTHKKYAKGFTISEDASEDDIDGAITNSAPAMGIAAQQSIETLIWSVFANGFSTSFPTPDGAIALFSASHQLRGGGTFSNLVSGDLSVANLETALNIFDTMVDERGNLINMEAGILLIPPQLRWIAHEILRSELRSDTANNATNAFNQVGLKVVMCKYLTNTTDWFLGVPPSGSKLMVYWRRRPVTDHTMDFDTGNFKTKMSYRLSYGAADWRGWVGGDGS